MYTSACHDKNDVLRSCHEQQTDARTRRSHTYVIRLHWHHGKSRCYNSSSGTAVVALLALHTRSDSLLVDAPVTTAPQMMSARAHDSRSTLSSQRLMASINLSCLPHCKRSTPRGKAVVGMKHGATTRALFSHARGGIGHSAKCRLYLLASELRATSTPTVDQLSHTHVPLCDTHSTRSRRL